MVTSNSLEVITGTAKVAMGDMAVSDWLTLIMDILTDLRTELKYFGKEVTLGSGLTGWGNRDAERNIDSRLIQWPHNSDINQYAKVILLAKFIADEMEKRETVEGHEWRKTEFQVFLTRDVELVIIKIRFECASVVRFSAPNFERDKAIKCQIFKPTKDQLSEYLGKEPRLGLMILERLHKLLEQSIQKREECLQRQKEKLAKLGGMLSRITE
jgi:hypothetical protein